MKKIYIIIGIIVILSLAVILKINSGSVITDNTTTGTSTSTGGTGVEPLYSGVEGTVTLGPTCPVMRIPPDPACADKPYSTNIQIIAVGSPKSSPFATVQSDENGNYKIMLPPGQYTLEPASGSVKPRCETKNVVVVASEIIKVDLSCDTGIR